MTPDPNPDGPDLGRRDVGRRDADRREAGGPSGLAPEGAEALPLWALWPVEPAPPEVRRTGPDTGEDVQVERPRRGEGPAWDGVDRFGRPAHALFKVAEAAAELRSSLERDLARGEVRADEAVFARYRAGFGALADHWSRDLGPTAEPSFLGPRPDGPEDLEDAEADAELALGRVLAWGTDGCSMASTSAVRSRAGAVAGPLGAVGAGLLGQAVAAQYGLALAHRDAAEMGLSSALTGRVGPAAGSDPEGGSETGPPPLEALMGQMAALIGAAGGDAAGGGPAGGGVAGRTGSESEGGRLERLWRRRVARAEVGVKNAARLVRHAQKAGVLPPPP